MTNLTERAVIAEGLRKWAKGSYTDEAAVELLIRFSHGRLLTTPCVEDLGDGYHAIDPVAAAEAGPLSGGEFRMLRLAVSLVSSRDRIPVQLGDVLPGLDRDALALVLAAIAHAGGSHEHSRTRFTEDGTYAGPQMLPALYPWPDDIEGDR